MTDDLHTDPTSLDELTDTAAPDAAEVDAVDPEADTVDPDESVDVAFDLTGTDEASSDDEAEEEVVIDDPGPGPAPGTSCTPRAATRRRSRPTSVPASPR